MAISEIGLLKLKAGQSFDDPTLQDKLAGIRLGLYHFTGFPFYFLQQVEDPSYICLLGEWKSLKSHYEDMHNSTNFKENLAEMSQYFEFQWMAHYDFDMDQVNLNSPYLEVARFTLGGGEKKEQFERAVPQVTRQIDGSFADIKVVSGWKIDEKREADEFVLLIPFESPEQRSAFNATGGAKSVEELVALAEKADIQHIRKQY